MSGYAELQVTTDFSFLRGASHADELFTQAAMLGIPALGVTDRNSLAGIVRAWKASKETGVRMIVGCRLDPEDAPPLLVYPQTKAAYSRLCRLLTMGKSRAGKGKCQLRWEDVAADTRETVAVLLPGQPDDGLKSWLGRHRDAFGHRSYMAMILNRRPDDAVRLETLSAMARAAKVGGVVTNDVLYHEPDRRILHDVMTCIREGCTIDDVGFRRERRADRYLKAPEEMARLFARHPEALERTLEINGSCRFDMSELLYQYPNETSDPAVTPQQELDRLTWEAAAVRYPAGVPDKVSAQLRHELSLIGQLAYAPYFLTVNSIVRFARSKGILCQGRGSAANSAVCYVLGITSIDPARSDLLFERFVSAERHEPPDIDVDFEHERREEVIQWVYAHYGRDRAALCCTVTRYRTKGAVREVGKALGLSEDITAALSSQVRGWDASGVADEHVRELNLNLEDPRLRMTLDIAGQLIGFPRHLGQHPGGFVLTSDRLDDLVPVEPASMADRQVIEWDKDDIDLLRMMKVDVLGLGMLGCMRRGFDLLEEHKGQRLDLSTVPSEDPATYDMICKADTLGTFQIESRAQMAMLPRLKPRTFYDLVIEVALVRPGPIQGDMVHPYLRRREKLEPVTYPTPELERVLGKTLGVPLFQEQAMNVAIHCAGFTPAEADQLRRAMATFKFTGGVSHFKEKLTTGMEARGYTREFAERTFSQIEGFGSYGFPESHAASFALVAYASSWMKCHHPDVFCCALLNAQPMGFYAPAQIVRDAENHGVEILPVDVNSSRWDCLLEPGRNGKLAVRLGLRMVKGLNNADAAVVVTARGEQRFATVDELWRRANVPVAALEKMAEADAFASTGVDRRKALWAIKGLKGEPLPLFAAADQGRFPRPEIVEQDIALVPMPEGGEVVEDYRSVGLSLKRHPVSFLRERLSGGGVVTCEALGSMKDGRRINVAGLVLVRQRPGTAKGVMFLTIEDETGFANLIVWQSVFEKQRRLILSAGMISCRGRLQREGDVMHVVTDRLEDLTPLLHGVSEMGQGDGGDDTGAWSPKNGGRCAEPGRASRIRVQTRDFR